MSRLGAKVMVCAPCWTSRVVRDSAAFRALRRMPSSSLMTAYLKGKSLDETRMIFDEFHKMVLGEMDPEKQEHHLGKLKLFRGIREYPSRTKCASLAWHTMIGALDKKIEEISTE